MKQGTVLRSIGPAIIVAAVVLGPGSILTSSRVGAGFGWIGLPVLLVAVILMIGMVALSARLGAVYENSLCDELASRLGRPVAIIVAAILFVLIALFQSSNNVAVVAGLEPVFESGEGPSWLASRAAQIGVLIGLNVLVIASLYLMRSVYRTIELAMKVLVLLMVVAFLLNFVVVLFGEKPARSTAPAEPVDWWPLVAMIGTTFSVAGAFFQAYLVREKGWGLADVKKGTVDAVVGISILGGLTAVILMTSVMVFHRAADAPALSNVGDVARQLEPFFGTTAKFVFCGGILAGALSSFLVNSVIGGTVMSDGLGLGSRMEDRWARHFTTLSLLTGMGIGILGVMVEGGRVTFITVAQALTVLGIPALALALLYLATRNDLRGERRIPAGLIALAGTGTLVAIALAVRTAMALYAKL